MQIKKEFAVREVCGDYLLVPIGATALDLNGMITTNEVGASVWNLLARAKNEEELVACILDEYEADEAQVRCDVHEFLQQLRALGIVE